MKTTNTDGNMTQIDPSKIDISLYKEDFNLMHSVMTASMNQLCSLGYPISDELKDQYYRIRDWLVAASCNHYDGELIETRNEFLCAEPRELPKGYKYHEYEYKEERNDRE